MNKRVFAFVFLLAASWVAKAETPSRWFEVRSPHFVVLTDSNEKQARKVAAQFERMRALFQTLLPSAGGDAGMPITVLALKDRKGFQSLEPAAYLAKGQLQLAGLFLRTQDRNYILLKLDAEGEHPFAVVYHEYTHFVLRKAEYLPLWLNEGLAEFYQNTDINEKDVNLGHPARPTFSICVNSECFRCLSFSPWTTTRPTITMSRRAPSSTRSHGRSPT